MSEIREADDESPGRGDSPASSGLRIVIPDTGDSAQPNELSPQGSDVSKGTSAGTQYEVGDAFAGLRLEGKWQNRLPASSVLDSEEDENRCRQPDVE